MLYYNQKTSEAVGFEEQKRESQPSRKQTAAAKKAACIKNAYDTAEFTSCKEVVKIQINKKGEILRVNKDAEKIFGIQRKKMIGLKLSIFLHPEDVKDDMSRILHKHHSEKERIVFHRNRILDKWGNIYLMSWVSTQFYSKKGTLKSVSSIATGILKMPNETTPAVS